MKKTFIISGCASGIGKHMALSLARAPQQHNVVMIDIHGEALDAMVREHGLSELPRVVTEQHDVRDAVGWERIVQGAVERFGGLDVMLNIAGYLKPGFVDALPPAEIDRHIDVNVKGVMYATHVGAQQMKRQRRGHIVNIASLAGIGHVPGLSAYCASKHAVRGFTLAVAHELARDGVAVTVICPDAVETPMLDLQVSYDEAAMTFGAGRGLTLAEVEAAVLDVLEKRPLERVIPVPGSGRGALSKLANAFPELAKLGLRQTIAKGRKAQVARKPAVR
jgi:NAD(P)-dependent dehydrogenase (short-subunit alcohol dehydrogenase family)